MSYKEKHTESLVVNEPMAMYITQSSYNPFYCLLGSVKTSGSTTDFNIIELARQG